MKTIYRILAILGFLAGCSNDPEPGCYQEMGLDIIETIQSQTGSIRGPGNLFCGESFVLEPDERVERRPLGALVPCNLSAEFQSNGIRVLFSGYVYERINDGDQCADFFEITEIEVLSELP